MAFEFINKIALLLKAFLFFGPLNLLDNNLTTPSPRVNQGYSLINMQSLFVATVSCVAHNIMLKNVSLLDCDGLLMQSLFTRLYWLKVFSLLAPYFIFIFARRAVTCGPWG